ncbi:lipoprotein [Spiroplasma endosymbiont of Stenodema calcarata]|uniref:lipoprotein n=1 Tax=Spiroplasma endosymbiont of Stenodema calcarata TaxID=3139328 RepID=UPI003CCA931A
MKKLLSILTVTALTTTPAITVISCKNENKVTPKKETEKQLGDLITKIDLGELVDKNKETILTAVKAKNPGVPADLSVGKIDDTSAVITSASVKGEVAVTFTVKPVQKQLVELITEKALGQLDDNNAVTIVKAVKAKNSNAPADMKVSDIKEGSAVIKSDSAIGEVLVTFTIKPVQKQLVELITKTDLGELADKTEETILAAVKEKNPNAPDDLSVDKIDDTSAVITSASVKGEVAVTFTIKEIESKEGQDDTKIENEEKQFIINE